VPILLVGFPQAGSAGFLVAAHWIEIGHEALAVLAVGCFVVNHACPLMDLFCLDPSPR
jgi:predicted ATP-grasp superfamily ATP-dependent carboligase